MVRKKAKIDCKFTFQPIDINDVEWRKTSSQYDEIVERVGNLRINEAILVHGIEKDYVPSHIRLKVYKKFKGTYRIRTKFNADKNSAFFCKTAK